MSPTIGAFDPPHTNPRESLLMLSDVHLGSDLVEHTMPEGGARRSRRADDDLVKLLEHYTSSPPTHGDRWRLVVAGDLIDFIGMSVAAPVGEPLETAQSDEEIAHGLGNAADHARLKLRRVTKRHEEVFAALAHFVEAGNALTVLRGNHDIEFHWPEVQREFCDALACHAPALSPVAIASRVEFHDWFYYVDGVAYVEHGHQYDELCSVENVMAPLSPLDPRRTVRGFCEILLRFVVRPTRGLREYGHEELGVFDYLRFGLRLGLGGCMALGQRFVRAIVELISIQRASVSPAAVAMRAEHERRVEQLSVRTRIGLDRLRALAALQVAPVTRTVHGILGTLLVDRIALAVVGTGLVASSIALTRGRPAFFAVAPVVVGAWYLVHRTLAGRRQIDPADALVERAGKLAKLFPAAFVVMGHTHTPAKAPLNDAGATYVNLGSWAEDEDGDSESHSYRAARTHLVIHNAPSGPVAEFLSWDSVEGPKHYPTLAPKPDKKG